MNASSPDSRPLAMLVLGMHRSGTSATAGSLRLLGVELGDRLIEPADDNRKGYWEHAAAVGTHEDLLAALSRSWNDVRPLPADWLSSPAADIARSEIRAIVAEFATTPFWALKDPRLSHFTPLWLAELHHACHVPRCLFVIRHPEEVAASLRVRNGVPRIVSHVLWIRHVLEAARDTADVPRAMITYEALLEDPCGTLDSAARTLGLEWPVPPIKVREKLRTFLHRAERYQATRASPEPAVDFSGITALVSDMYLQCVTISESGGDWSNLARFGQTFNAFDIANHGWIEAMGEIQQADAIMLGRVSKQLHEQFVTLDDELSAIGAAKAAAESLAHARLDTLTRTVERIGELESLSLERLAEIQHLSARMDEINGLALSRMMELQVQSHARETAEQLAFERLAETQRLAAALAEAEKLGLDRLEEIQRLSAQLDDANALALNRMDELQAESKAHEKAEQLAFERLAEIQRLAAALAEAEKLGLDRLEEIQRLSAQLDDANALALDRMDEVQAEAKAHEKAEQMALERLAEIERLTLQVDEANALTLSRWEELQVARAATREIDELLLERIEQIEHLSVLLEDSKAQLLSRSGEVLMHARALEDAHSRNEEMTAEIAALREHLETLKRSLAWRMAAPAHALESWVKRKYPNR